jgi:hypothetical protein
VTASRDHGVSSDHGADDHGADDQESYTGPATLTAGVLSVPCDVVITGYFEPVSGRYRWYGRARGQGLDALPAKGARLRTPHSSAQTTVSDVDLWGRYRLQGFGRPPFPVPYELAAPSEQATPSE